MYQTFSYTSQDIYMLDSLVKIDIILLEIKEGWHINSLVNIQSCILEKVLIIKVSQFITLKKKGLTIS